MSKKATVDCLRRHFKEDVRPTFHFTPRRIEAHVCICFVALKVYKELERLLKRSGCPYSVDEVLKIAETVVTIEIARPENNNTVTKTLCLTEKERAIAYLIATDDWLTLLFGDALIQSGRSHL